MREATGGWIPGAIAAARRVAAVAPAQRTVALRREASIRGIQPVTLRRILYAARYVEHHAKAGLECRASVMAVEALVRLEKRAPARAAELRAKVFSGELTSRQIAALAQQDHVEARGHRVDANWSGLAIEVCEIFFEDFESFTGTTAAKSEKRNFFMVDVEVNLPDARQGAIFFSPELAVSAMRAMPFSRQMTMAIAALASYDQVVMLVTTEAEKSTYLYALEFLCLSVGTRLRALDHTPGKLTLLER